MAADEPSGPRPAPVVLRIKLRYDDVEAMAQRFAANIGKSGLFVPTKSLQPVGAEVKFELRLANDAPVITGLGKVRATRAADPANPRAAFGMAIELLRVTRESRDVILKLLERRRQLGLPDVAIPMPDDIDAARRVESDTGVGSSPKDPAVPRESGPIGVDSGLAFTSPRRPTGPIAVAKVHTVAALAPEPPRKRRAPVQELIESASGRVVAVMLPGLDEDVDVAAVLARARILAGGDLDAELDALSESSAAPIEISIEAASAELARQLGGKAVSRDRSARWAPLTHPVAEGTPAPMPIIQATPAPMPIVEALPDPEPAPVVEAAPVEEPTPVVEEQAPVVEEPTPVVEAAPVITAPEPIVEEPTPVAELAPSDLIARESSPALPVEPDQIADEIHRLADEDVEEVERAPAVAEPDPTAFEHHTFVTEPSVVDLERSLEQQLADVDDDDLGLAAAAEPAHTVEIAPAPEVEPEPEPEELDAEELEEINEFEILAEADALDADLLAAHGEADASTRVKVPVAQPPARVEPAPRLSDSDFASRLDLGDDDDEAPPLLLRDPRERSLSEIDPTTGELDPMMVSAAHAIAAFDDDPDSKAAVKRYIPPEPAAEAFPPLHSFDQSDVIKPGDLPPRARRESNRVRPQPSPAPVPPPAADGYDLETALEALDVDLDDLSFPHAKTELPRKLGASPRRHPRAASEDGVLIDFDDDE